MQYRLAYEKRLKAGIADSGRESLADAIKDAVVEVDDLKAYVGIRSRCATCLMSCSARVDPWWAAVKFMPTYCI
jgi:bacterioferritin-associated ferredoxin